MSGGLERILTLTFGKEGNEANHLGHGWSGDEPGLRWMIGQVSDLWLEHPGPDHDLILELDIDVVAEEAAGGPVQRLVVGVRGQGVAQIAVARGGTLGFHIPARLVAAPGPMRLMFIHPDFRRPMDLHGGTDDRELSLGMRALRISRVLPRPAQSGAAELPAHEMIMRFESLGDNCEFGLVQRKLGAEPLGLLRFAYIEVPALSRGLRCGFAGLGDPDTTGVIVDGVDREFVVRDTVYGMTYHTFQYESQTNIETVRAQQTTRLNFLKRKLMEDAAHGEKIFVIKREEALRPEEVLAIYAALNDLGQNWLLWVTLSDDKHAPGTVERLLPGLVRGYVDRFAPFENAHDMSADVWTRVCDVTWRAIGGN